VGLPDEWKHLLEAFTEQELEHPELITAIIKSQQPLIAEEEF
jgi:hypothetical protein